MFPQYGPLIGTVVGSAVNSIAVLFLARRMGRSDNVLGWPLTAMSMDMGTSIMYRILECSPSMMEVGISHFMESRS